MASFWINLSLIVHMYRGYQCRKLHWRVRFRSTFAVFATVNGDLSWRPNTSTSLQGSTVPWTPYPSESQAMALAADSPGVGTFGPAWHRPNRETWDSRKNSSVKNEGSKNSDLALPRNWVYRPKKPSWWLGKRMISQWIRIYDFRICCNLSFDNGHASKLEKPRWDPTKTVQSKGLIRR